MPGNLPAECRQQRLALLLAIGQRRAVIAAFRESAHVHVLPGNAREWPVQPVAIAEPVAAEHARHRVPAAGFTALGACECAERNVAMNVAEIEIASTRRRAHVP